MKVILRKKSVITGKKNLEHLYSFHDFPVYMGCVEKLNPGDDLKAEMSFSICKDMGMIQLDKVLPLDVVYKKSHSDGIGKVWSDHYRKFADFVVSFGVKNVLEIGGGNGMVAKNAVRRNSHISWIILEPNPLFRGDKKIKVIKGWFNEQYTSDDKFDVLVHSHVLEHVYQPREFLRSVFKFLKEGDKHIFAVPNLYKSLKNKNTNTLNFEHTVFLTEYFVDYLLKREGFKILKKEYYLDHSIYYATERLNRNERIRCQSKYEEYKKIFNQFIRFHESLIKTFNQQIKSFQGELYLFGAHIFSQSLLGFGLNSEKIKSILDNSKLKQGKRLYGTSYLVYSPEILKNKKSSGVILRAGPYQKEIKDQLLGINKKTIIFE